jgi:hypothetical protein
MQTNLRVRISVCMFLVLCSRREQNTSGSKHKHKKATDSRKSINIVLDDENPAWHGRLMLARRNKGDLEEIEPPRSCLQSFKDVLLRPPTNSSIRLNTHQSAPSGILPVSLLPSQKRQ